MQGQRQRSATVPDYKALAGKVTRAPRSERHDRETAGRNHAKEKEVRAKEIKEQIVVHESKEKETPAATEVHDENAFVDASNTTNTVGGAYKSAALQILQSERRLMSVGEIVKLAVEHKLIKSSGRSPEVTMSSALHAEVRKRGLLSVFFRPKAGLFGLKAWLSEIWLQEWLIKEGLNPEDFAPELMEAPQNKRQRIMNAKPAHRSDPRADSRADTRVEQRNDHRVDRSEQHRSEHHRKEQQRGEQRVDQRVELKNDREHRGAVVVGSRSGTSQTEMETDSDERTSNLNLLLEAADELDKEDDRDADQAQQLARKGSHAITSSTTPTHSRETNPQTSEKTKRKKVAAPSPPTPSEVEQAVEPSQEPAPLPQFNPITSPHRFLPKGGFPPLPPTLPPPPFAMGMNYALPGAALINPILAQQLFAQHGSHGPPPGASLMDPSRLGVMPLGLPFAAAPAALMDPMAHMPPLGHTPSSAAPSPTSAPKTSALPALASSPSGGTLAPLSLECTGRSIVSILKAAKQREADREKENDSDAPVKREPLNILNLPLPSFDTEDYDSSDEAAALKNGTDMGVKPDDEAHLNASHSQADLAAMASVTPGAGENREAVAGDCDGKQQAANAAATTAAGAGGISRAASTTVDDALLNEDRGVRGAVAAAPASANVSADDGGPKDMEEDTAAQPEPSAQPAAVGTGVPASDIGTSYGAGAAPAPVSSAGLGAKKEAAAARLALRELKRAAEEGGGNGATSSITGKALEHEKINMFRQHIQILETNLGSMHPQVGKAYVFLARALQHEGSRWSLTMAQRALLRAWQILASVKTRVNPDQPASLNDFSYLMGHLQETQMAHAFQIQHQIHFAANAQAQAFPQAKLAQMFMMPQPGMVPPSLAAVVRPQ